MTGWLPSRRQFMGYVPLLAASSAGRGATAAGRAGGHSVEKWGLFELSLPGTTQGNPFVDVGISARFTQGARSFDVPGFYDGGGVYKVRFMPDAVGSWRYETFSNRLELNGRTGRVEVTAPGRRNRGPVRVHNTYHFAYADGTPFKPIGTTAYAWTSQEESVEQQTLKTLAGAPFNKLRMCVFPKRHAWNEDEPPRYPFQGNAPSGWDFSRFNPEYFQHFERRVAQLAALGIEADVILFHPYDKGHWGFDRMPPEADDLYLRYVVARLAAHRNVWWSIANEYDFLDHKAPADWDRFFQIVQASDPYGHLRSIHNGTLLYNHTLPWVTHASIQNGAAVEDSVRAQLYRDAYRKPIVYDEVKYEGDLPQRWGQLSAEELVHRCWQGTVSGTYVGHGETYRSPPRDIIWWAKGGVLRGQSPPRLAFLRKILESGPADGLEPIDKWQNYPFAGVRGQYYLGYFGRDVATTWQFRLYKADVADGMRFSVDVIDTWNMTITPGREVFETKRLDDYTYADKEGRSVVLPPRPYMSLRIRRQA